jgi:hypothetical protein
LAAFCDLRVHDIARLVVTALAFSAMLNVPARSSVRPAFTTREISAQIVQTAVDCVDDAWRTTTTDMNGAISGFAQASSSFSGFLSAEGTPNGSGLCLGVVRDELKCSAG